jgi:hypothetical protein
MSISNLVDSNRNLGNQSQNFCSKSSPPNILSRLVVGIVIKDVARIYDIAIHIIIGLGKIAICTTKIPYSIPARLCGSTPNYAIGKEGFAHLGFSGYYFADMFISLTNTINKYPKDKMEKVENLFSEFLGLKKNVISKEEKPKIQIKETVDRESLFVKEYEKYSVKNSPESAEEMATLSVKSHPKLFSTLYAEYVENNKDQKKVERKATEYANNCIRIYSPMCLKFLKKCSKEEAEEQALLYAKTYVNAHSKESARQPKTQSKEETKEKVDVYAKHFTELFFSEYQRCLKNTPETAEEQALIFAKKYLEIFYKACTLSPKTSKEKAKEITDSLFKNYLREIPKIIEKKINTEFYFTPYAQKYIECQANGRRSAEKIATRHAKRLTQELTPKMIEQFNKAKMESILNKKKHRLKKSTSI